jgi:hypothetical protein
MVNDMANERHLERLKQGGADSWNRWRLSNPAILPELRGADLSGADLTRANLLGANLSGAELNYALLTEALVDDEQLSSVKSWLGR